MQNTTFGFERVTTTAQRKLFKKIWRRTPKAGQLRVPSLKDEPQTRVSKENCGIFAWFLGKLARENWAIAL
jgi:hypothetical protein